MKHTPDTNNHAGAHRELARFARERVQRVTAAGTENLTDVEVDRAIASAQYLLSQELLEISRRRETRLGKLQPVVERAGPWGILVAIIVYLVESGVLG